VKVNWIKLIVIILISFIFINGCEPVYDSGIEENIRKKVVGTRITYYNIAGNPIEYEISEDNINSIHLIELNEETIWKVEIGKGLKWNLYYNKEGELIRTEQLFQT
jgi:hypothetical protein